MEKQTDTPMTSQDHSLSHQEPHSQFKMVEKITLTDKEKDIFNFLLSVLKENGKNTTLRVAGGWVRDKLLGL